MKKKLKRMKAEDKALTKLKKGKNKFERDRLC